MLNPLAIFTVVCFVVEIRCSRELCYKKQKTKKTKPKKKKTKNRTKQHQFQTQWSYELKTRCSREPCYKICFVVLFMVVNLVVVRLFEDVFGVFIFS